MNNPDNYSVIRTRAGKILDRSLVPTLLILVVLWVSAAVLLTLSILRQRDFTILKAGDVAPFSTWALTDFSYVDKAATRKARDVARAGTPEYFRISSRNSADITNDFETFLAAVRNRSAVETQKQKYSPSRNLPARLAGNFKEFDQLAKLCSDSRRVEKFRKKFNSAVSHGIAVPDQLAGKNIRVLTPEERLLDGFIPPLPQQAAEAVVDGLRGSGTFKSELAAVIAKLLGGGNLIYDEVRTEADRSDAAAGVPDIHKYCRSGELLIAQGAIISDEMVDKIKAEKEALPQNFGMAIFYYRLAVSFLLMVLAFFFLYITYPGFFQSPRFMALVGAVILLSILANYGVIYLFFHLFKIEKISDYQLLFALVPISFCAALCSAFLGNRSAIFSVFLVASVSAMMAFPDRSFEQTLRWFFIGVLVALSVRNVRNYRSFFLRVFIFGALSTALINSDMLLRSGGEIFFEAAAIIFLNSFGCAVASLLLVFAFELIFNADTSMSLMVLCDYSHPLLDELKRKAPGTMFHSMNVATLAEDAARAIGANPLRAKAGALFHDIGKLCNPHYFVENNVDSPAEHEKLPPRQSSSIIREHVCEGLNLSRKYRLSRFIREAVATHHGDDMVSFFYSKALEYHDKNPGAAPVNEADFRYGGEAPDGKELTIISLADACEAACRSLNDPAENNIREMVDNIFVHRLRQGQLRNSKITLNELNIIKECFIKDLVNFNHGRIAYNKENRNDPAEQQMVLPEQKSSRQE